MIPGSLARRYARALFGLAQTPAQRDKFSKDMDALAELVQARDPNGTTVLSVLMSNRHPLAQRRNLVDALARKVSADPTVVKFVQYVLERGRIEGVPGIARAFRAMADDAAGRVRATITSARPLAPDKLAGLKKAIATATGKEVLADTATDPDLIGGVVTQVGSYVIDGSVRQQLSDMRATLRGD